MGNYILHGQSENYKFNDLGKEPRPIVRRGSVSSSLTSSSNEMSFDDSDAMEIDRSEVVLVRKLCEGQFGDIFEGLLNDSVPVWVKTIRSNEMTVKDSLFEIDLMKKVQHSKIIRLIGFCINDSPILIVTEYMKNGSLLNYLQSARGRALKMSQLIDIGAQVAAGMAYLASQKCIHCDLAARNVFVGEENSVKIGGFSSARLAETEIYEPPEGFKFPVRWTSPEAIAAGRFSVKSDVWSFGILLSELVTYGRSPYPGMANLEVVRRVQEGYRMECPSNCPAQLYQVMVDCWKATPTERPAFEALKEKLEFTADLMIINQLCRDTLLASEL